MLRIGSKELSCCLLVLNSLLSNNNVAKCKKDLKGTSLFSLRCVNPCGKVLEANTSPSKRLKIKAIHGTTRALLKTLVFGIRKFKKELEIRGLDTNALLRNKNLFFT